MTSISKDCKAALGILKLLSRPHGLKELMPNIFLLMQSLSKCQSVGIRLKDGEDFPYYETVGFPPEFVQSENLLCVQDCQGEPVRDNEGNLILKCICGTVIMGRYDPELPFFTQKGAFWTNSTSDLLKSFSEVESLRPTRNTCNKWGYESVALVPLVSDNITIGLLQFNDYRKVRFKKENIDLFQELADILAVRLAQILNLER